MHQIDGATQFFAWRQNRLNPADRHAEAAQDPPHQPLDHAQNWRKQADGSLHRARHHQRHAVRGVERRRLRQNFRENKNHQRHRESRINDAGFAEMSEQQAGRQSRSGDIGEIIGEQDCAKEPLAGPHQPVDDAGVTVALLFQTHHRRARGCGKRGFARGKECRYQKAQNDRQYGQPIENAHRLASFSFKNVLTSRSSTPVSITAEPMARTRINVSIPRFTFLSWAISSMIRSRPGSGPGISGGLVGRPTSAKWRFTLTASDAGTRPRRAENSKASTMPTEMASPCSSRSENPQAASRA